MSARIKEPIRGEILSKPTITVARYLEHQLALCGKPQKDIAEACGYVNANIITMFKTGKTKVPLPAVGPMAHALGVDPGFFLRLVIKEYLPDTWDAIESILGGGQLVTETEVELIRVIRDASAGRPVDVGDPGNRKALGDTIKQMADRDQAKADAAVEAIERLPKNSRHR